MKLKMAVAIGAILAPSSGARTEDGVGRPQVSVCMERGFDHFLVIPRAQALTAEMFNQIGVALVWCDLKHCPEKGRPIVILVSVDSPRELFPGAPAVSYPFEGIQIRVFYDSVRTVTPSCPLPVLLAHVLAHEIGHILQRDDQHSYQITVTGTCSENVTITDIRSLRIMSGVGGAKIVQPQDSNTFDIVRSQNITLQNLEIVGVPGSTPGFGGVGVSISERGREVSGVS